MSKQDNKPTLSSILCYGEEYYSTPAVMSVKRDAEGCFIVAVYGRGDGMESRKAHTEEISIPAKHMELIVEKLSDELNAGKVTAAEVTRGCAGMNQAVALKADLERDILALLLAYQAKTGATPTDVSVSTVLAMPQGGPNELHLTEARVTAVV